MLYRLLGRGTPSPADFQPTRETKARLRGLPEIMRVGFSHYLTPEAARRVRRRKGSRIAQLTLPDSPLVHVAKTGTDPAHVTVWAPVDLLLDAVDVVLENG